MGVKLIGFEKLEAKLTKNMDLSARLLLIQKIASQNCTVIRTAEFC